MLRVLDSLLLIHANDGREDPGDADGRDLPLWKAKSGLCAFHSPMLQEDRQNGNPQVVLGAQTEENESPRPIQVRGCAESVDAATGCLLMPWHMANALKDIQ
jgi:hypothetical protein